MNLTYIRFFQMLRVVACFISCGYVMTSLGAVSETFVIDSSPVQLVSPEVVSYWVEETTTAPSLIINNGQQQWQPVDLVTISAGMQSFPVWFRIPIKGTSNEVSKRLLELRWVNVDTVDFYLRRQDSIEERSYGMDEYGVLTRSTSASFIFPFSLQPDEHAEIFVRISSRYVSFVPLFIWQPEAYEDHHANFLNWYCLGFGALLALLLYNLFLYTVVRDVAYFYYCCYTASIIFYELALNGMGSYLFWGDIPWMHRNALALGVSLSFLTGTLFMRAYLDVGKYSLWLLRLVDLSIVARVVALVALLIAGIFLQSSIYLDLITCLGGILISGYLWYLGNPAAKLYLYAWGALLLFTMGTLLTMTGVLAYMPLTEHGQMIGFVTEMLMLSFALATRINRERDQREQAQQQSLQLQLSINQERENTINAQQQVLEMEKQQKQLLETRVAERTHTLRQTMEELEQANLQLAHLTVTDALTQVANRRHFDEILLKELRRAERNKNPLALILIDIDHFKQLNDLHGHLAGDECLRQFAATVRSVVPRASDLVARYGGEEFAIILPEIDERAAYVVAEKIRLAVQEMVFRHKNKAISITASLGLVSLNPAAVGNITAVIEAADLALYQAKNNGRNCCRVGALSSTG